MMNAMKRITLTVEIEEASNRISWELDDWRGTVSAGSSIDTTENLVHLWAGDIDFVLKEARQAL
jgi:hypothetical protein